MNHEPTANATTRAVADHGETPPKPSFWKVYVTSRTSTDTRPYAAPAPAASVTQRTIPSRSAPTMPNSTTAPAMISHATSTEDEGNTTALAGPDASAPNNATPSVLAPTAIVAARA